ncbi:metallophosphoesterase family protein [Paenibacillus psychroresistens]|uniref:metallophosphoesterase family protein n=1 Tax=Paenibacillus psychroresistens TaxID=1778678 RepID=UPI001D055816|nr:metallophosphoesterase family protein [Paenibacillus psychroresistens]
MTRTLVVSDIHGCYAKWIDLLRKVEFKPKADRLIILGDYVDRGLQSREVVDHIIRLVQDGEAIALRGNHDQRFMEWVTLNNTLHDTKFVEHGGLQTINSYCQSKYSLADILKPGVLEQAKALIRKNYRAHIQFIDSLPLYYEDDYHIYVHAGLNPFYKTWKEQPERDFIWIRDAFVRQPTVVDKMVVFGHSKTVDIQGTGDIWFGGDKIGIDGGCAYGLQLNCLEITLDQDQVSYYNFSV